MEEEDIPLGYYVNSTNTTQPANTVIILHLTHSRCALFLHGTRTHTLTRLSPPIPCRLRPVDVEFMKALHEKVNVVPLIAKADCLTPNEIKKLKDRVSSTQQTD